MRTDRCVRSEFGELCEDVGCDVCFPVNDKFVDSEDADAIAEQDALER